MGGLVRILAPFSVLFALGVAWWIGWTDGIVSLPFLAAALLVLFTTVSAALVLLI